MHLVEVNLMNETKGLPPANGLKIRTNSVELIVYEIDDSIIIENHRKDSSPEISMRTSLIDNNKLIQRILFRK